MMSATTVEQEAVGDCFLIESQSDSETNCGSHTSKSDSEDDASDSEERERSSAGGTWAVLNYPKRPEPTSGDSALALNPVMKQLHNARRHEIRSDQDMLDIRGFKLVEHNTQVQDFGSLAEMQRVYYRELQELCKKHIHGVERCVVFDHKCRRGDDAVNAGNWSEQMQSCALKDHSPSAEVVGYGGIRKPLQLVHGDYTRPDAIKRVRALAKVPSWDSARNFAPQLSHGEVEDIIANKRFMLINVWRNTDRSRALKRFPLACLDASTVNDDEDVFDWAPAESNFSVYDGFAAHPDNFVPGQLCLEANERHRWLYYPDMIFSEALLFKTFDSAEAIDGQEKLARACFHTAFRDPATVESDPDRQSCEARLLVILRND
eukprot:TRINITY_DN4332_c0_g2_i1.p1 TRINITY_DN4332_c0_g2~~TRINITY_DN4332_c0_g2_i1.p1  ORF type:complete len:430 (+),score=82.01 TRINITY_DN4332_c0_g2_i1:164-1291(+)